MIVDNYVVYMCTRQCCNILYPGKAKWRQDKKDNTYSQANDCKGRFTRYDFVAYNKLTTGLQPDLEPVRQS